MTCRAEKRAGRLALDIEHYAAEVKASPMSNHNLTQMILTACTSLFAVPLLLSAQPKPASTPRSPAPRYAHQMMTYDEGSKRVLLFGGAGQNASYGDLWEWDGKNWKLLSETGPAPRNSGVLVYDARRKRTVLYGGRGGSSALLDTWEWDGARWHLMDQQGPSPGIHTAAAFDRKRGVVVLFVPLLPDGPSTNPLRAETWTWNGKHWMKRDASAPPGCLPMGMAFDEAKGTVVMLVGKFEPLDSAVPTGGNELWEWTGTNWHRNPVLPPAVKEPFQSNIVAAGPHGGLLLFDGSAETTWLWDQKQWTQVSKSGPSERNVHVLAYDKSRQRVVLFGGSKQRQRLGDTWEWDGKRWTQIKY